MVKFSDDTVLLSILQGTESGHGNALSEFVKWCNGSYLDLNVSKTNELVFDFRKQKTNIPASSINGNDVEIVDSYRYLGTQFDSQLKFDINTESIVKKAHQRIYLLRRINSFGVSKPILCSVYASYIESLLTFSFICSFNSLTVKDGNNINQIVKICSKIIGIQLNDLNYTLKRRMLQRAKCITSCSQGHVLSGKFTLMPSGRRYVQPPRRTNRYSKSFVPSG